MGWLRKLLDFLSGKNKTKLLNPPKNIETQIQEARKNRNEVEIDSFDNENKVILWDAHIDKILTHEDGYETNLVIAKIIRKRDEDAYFIDSNDYVLFEVDRKQEISEELLEKVAECYDLVKRPDSKELCTYLGLMGINKENQTYNIMSKLPGTEQYIRKIIEPHLEGQRRKREQSFQRQEFLDRIDERETIDNYKEKQKEINAERLKRPYLEETKIYRSSNNKSYEDFEGININNGEILRLHQARKIGKIIKENGNSSYLYSGILNSVNSITDEITINKAGIVEGFPICFELPDALDRIVEKNDEVQIKQVLRLLSYDKNFENAKELKYIGKLTSDDVVEHVKESDNEIIRKKVQEEKQEYRKIIDNMER